VRLAAMSPVERRQESARIKKEQAAAAAAKAKAKRAEQAATTKAKLEEAAAAALSIFGTKKAPAKAADLEAPSTPASIPSPLSTAAKKAASSFGTALEASAAKSAPKPVKQMQATRATPQAGKSDAESPAQLFERVAGSVWVPPSRPDLKERLSATPAAKGMAKPTNKAPSTKAKAARAPAASPPKFSFGSVAPKSAPKPAKQTQAKRAATQQKETQAESPAQLFERVAGSVWVPPSRPDLKGKMGK